MNYHCNYCMYTCGFRINANLVKEGSFPINVKLVKEEIWKEARRQVNISSTFIPSTTIASAGQLPFNSLASESRCCVSLRCTSYTRCRPTRPIPVQCWVSVSGHCWFNAGQSSTMLAQHMAFTQCCFNVDPQSSTLTQQWSSIGWLFSVCSNCVRVTLSSPVAISDTSQITRYISSMLM